MSIRVFQYCEPRLAKSASPLCIACFAILLLSSCITPPYIRHDTAHGVLDFIGEECPCLGDPEAEQQTSHKEHNDIPIHVRRAECIWIREYLRIRATMAYSAEAPAALMPVRLKFHGFSSIPSCGKTTDIRKELSPAAILILTVAENGSVEKQRIIAEYNIDWNECGWVLGHYSFDDADKAERMEGRDAEDLCIRIEPGDTVDISVIFKCGERKRTDRWIHDGLLQSSFLRRKIEDKSACYIARGCLEIPFLDAEGQQLFQGELTFQIDTQQKKPKLLSNYLWRIEIQLPDEKI